jgi:predicted nucleic acid-binding protein
MRVLVDTCVWTLCLGQKAKPITNEAQRRLADALTDAIRDGRVAMIGPIRQEILSGVKDDAEFERLKTALDAFQDEPLTRADYEEAARLLMVCRARGVESGPVDMLLCAVAAQRHWELLTFD